MASYRISLGCTHEELLRRLRDSVDLPTIESRIDQDQFVPQHHIGPSGQAAILLGTDGADGISLNRVATSRLVLRTMPWGMVAQQKVKHQIKDVTTYLTGAEMLRKNSMRWKSIKGSKRCAVVCLGYHFWHHTAPPSTSKVPYFVRFDDNRLMFLAGLYDECSRADDPLDITSRFALVTTKANAEMKWLTDRQPVILSTAADVNAWLDVSSGLSFPQLHHLFEPHDQSDLEKKLTWYQVPKELGDSRKDSRELTLPVHNRPDGIETVIASIVPDIEEVQPPQASGSTVVSSSQPGTATQIASSSSQAIATASSSTQATPSQPATSIPASQGIRPTRAHARPKVEGGVEKRRAAKAKKFKGEPVPPEGKLDHYFNGRSQ
ncbi:DUF159-domain-containing protein [Stereum hirsutum FP-91666 SS1]|uniref:DUF159-domain-containing protein n=1 Tax=Stereum hirsutum (strain FP-91666) TaxID=721885 RepID=UPI000444A101|nr:DUF159-domain-containing protein [Stereum hirsutum FP-91666 SS1]EIM84108.1 DUF159-domain-containing protein [Stereum hirsutum FP-91666 SS1]